MVQSINIKDYINGWFIGNFDPAIINTKDFEIAIKTYNKNQKEKAHYHKIATEITFIVNGKAKMCNKIISSGEGFILKPYDITDFTALTDCTTIVVKIPSVLNDKYDVL